MLRWKSSSNQISCSTLSSSVSQKQNPSSVSIDRAQVEIELPSDFVLNVIELGLFHDSKFSVGEGWWKRKTDLFVFFSNTCDQNLISPEISILVLPLQPSKLYQLVEHRASPCLTFRKRNCTVVFDNRKIFEPSPFWFLFLFSVFYFPFFYTLGSILFLPPFSLVYVISRLPGTLIGV